MKVLVQDGLKAYPSGALERDLRALPPWRRKQAMEYAFDEGKRNCALAYLLLCRALREEYGIADQPTFVIGEHGKPALAEYPHIHFNLSHCRTAVVCAVSDSPVGIDIESLERKTNDSLVSYTMNNEEQRQIADSGKHTFFRLWTMKEALVKLRGTGLQESIPDLLLPANTIDISFTTEERPERGYVFSIAQYRTSK